METKDIQKLIDFIAQSGLDEVNIETSELKLAIKRYSGVSPVAMQIAAPQQVIAPTPAAPIPPTPVAEKPVVAEVASNLITVRSPMIGTFYRTPSPDKPNFVDIGDEITVGKVLCIVEAMKLFNEIESEISGKIVKILVENSMPVEFEQPLFLVEPN